MKLKIFIFIVTLALHTSLLNAGSINYKLNIIASIITINKISILAYASGMFAILASVGFFAQEPSKLEEKIITFGGAGISATHYISSSVHSFTTITYMICFCYHANTVASFSLCTTYKKRWWSVPYFF